MSESMIERVAKATDKLPARLYRRTGALPHNRHHVLRENAGHPSERCKGTLGLPGTLRTLRSNRSSKACGNGVIVDRAALYGPRKQNLKRFFRAVDLPDVFAFRHLEAYRQGKLSRVHLTVPVCFTQNARNIAGLHAAAGI